MYTIYYRGYYTKYGGFFTLIPDSASAGVKSSMVKV
jgi:hypothetical protein